MQMHYTQLQRTNSWNYHTVQVTPQNLLLLPQHTAQRPYYHHIYVHHCHTVLRTLTHTNTCVYIHYHHNHHHTMQVAMCTHMHLCTPVGLVSIVKKHYRCKLQMMTAMNISEVCALVDNWKKYHQRMLQRVKTTYIRTCMHTHLEENSIQNSIQSDWWNS